MGYPGEEIAEEDQRDDEEADRPAVLDRRPVVAVVGHEDPEPHRGNADQPRGQTARAGLRVRRSAVAAGPTSSAVLRIVPIVNAASATAAASARR